MSKDDPTFSIKDELQGKRGRGRPRSLREELGDEEYRKSLMQRTMHALSISEKYTEALVKRLHQNDSIRSLLLSSALSSSEADSDSNDSKGSKKRKAENSPSDAKSGKLIKGSDGSSQPLELSYINSQGFRVSTRQPKLLEGAVMRDYQLDGLDWLVALDLNGANGILADEMGLGKTLQVISLICFLVDLGVGGEAPFLVIGPLSTLHNWECEFRKFAPQIPVVLYHGKQDERVFLKKKILEKKKVNDHQSYPVVITSYEMPLKDQDLRRINWRYLIIDEGHRLKNHNCLLIKELRRYHTINRLLLTGTPLQNNMTELWSLLNFILPGIVNDMDVFESWFDTSSLEDSDSNEKIVEAEEKNKVLTTLHKILKPFIMRRVKADVGLNIPPKKEIFVYAPMTEWQQRLYSAVVDKTLNSLQGTQANLDPVQIEKASRRKAMSSVVKTSVQGNEIDDTNSAVEGPPPVKILSGDKENSPSKPTSVNSPAMRTSPRTTRVPRKHLRARRRSTVNAGDYKLLANGVPLNAIREEPVFSKEDSSNFGDIDLDAAKDKLLEGLAEPDEEYVTEMKISNPVVLLRKICNHPYLASFPVIPGTRMLKIDEKLVQRSGKMKVLDALLQRLKKNGHKVLLFSNFTSMLDIIEDYLLFREYQYTRLDGSRDITDRQMNIKKFSSDDDIFVFLISTRAGGLGINLVAADTVIIFDSDWNPQVDLQAQDRCHRIGQTKPVAVYRFVVRGTIDEQIIQRADTKKQLDKLIIQHGKFKNFKKNEVVSLQELRLLLAANKKDEVAVDSNLFYSNKELDDLCDRTALFSAHGDQKTSDGLVPGQENASDLISDIDAQSDHSDYHESFNSRDGSDKSSPKSSEFKSSSSVGSSEKSSDLSKNSSMEREL